MTEDRSLDARIDRADEIRSGHELYHDDVSLTVTFDRLNEPQAIALMALFETWAFYGRIGASRMTEFYADGDGTFHPDIDIDAPERVFQPGDEVFDELADAAEIADNTFDFDAVVGWFIDRALEVDDD